jgi:hypothetical protein
VYLGKESCLCPRTENKKDISSNGFDEAGVQVLVNIFYFHLLSGYFDVVKKFGM